jgi:hypothetical protein
MRREWRLVWCASGLLAVAVAGAGCGPGHGLTLGRVQGKVTYQGEPVRYGTVFFVPDVSKGTDGPSAMGIIKDDGTYILSTDSGGDGALVGHHKVGVVGLDPTPINKTSEKPLPNPEVSPVEYMQAKGKLAQQARTAPRKAAAAAAQEDTFTDRGGRTYRYVIPKKLGVPQESGLEVDVARGSHTIDFDIAEDGTARVVK